MVDFLDLEQFSKLLVVANNTYLFTTRLDIKQYSKKGFFCRYWNMNSIEISNMKKLVHL